jgi:hypothetical protein
MIPNIESFKQFCKVYNNSSYTYANYLFYNNELIFLEFPAYFYLNKINQHWIKTSKENCLKQVDETLQECEEKIQCLKVFKDSLNKISI